MSSPIGVTGTSGQADTARKWGWIGHTLRKPAPSIARQALNWNPQGKRKRGRPRNSWRRDTEAEMKQQGTSWSGMARAAQNKVRWRVAYAPPGAMGISKYWYDSTHRKPHGDKMEHLSYAFLLANEAVR